MKIIRLDWSGRNWSSYIQVCAMTVGPRQFVIAESVEEHSEQQKLTRLFPRIGLCWFQQEVRDYVQPCSR